MSMVLAIIVMIIAPMVVGIVVFLTVMRKKNTPRADGSMPKLGDVDLFQHAPKPLQRSKRKATTKPMPEEDVFKIPNSTF